MNKTLRILRALRDIRYRKIIDDYKETIHYWNASVIDRYEKDTGWAWK